MMSRVKKLLPIFFTIVGLVGLFAHTPKAYAENSGKCVVTYTVTSTGAKRTVTNYNTPESACKLGSAGESTVMINGKAEKQTANNDSFTVTGVAEEPHTSGPLGSGTESSDNWYDFLNPFKWIPAALGWIAYLILKIMSLILGLAGLLLNGAINKTIVHMSENVNSLTSINTTWKVIRDLMNIAFIFMLVYEGIKLIIGQGNISKVRTFVTGIVLASLLINFSLFFTKVMIDASNIITVGIYNNIIDDQDSTSVGLDRGLSNAYMKALGVQGVFSAGQIDLGGGQDGFSFLTANLGGAILFLVAAFVFLAVTVMLIVRYIVLIVLLILSPVGYMGMALPGMQKNANEWWETLWGQLTFPPLFMILTWVTLTVVAGGNLAGNATSSTGGLVDTGGTVNVIFNFAIIIGLAISSLVISKKYATQGSKFVGEATKTATNYAGTATMGAAARTGRMTLGRAGNDWANDEELKKRAAAGSKIARMQLAAGNKMKDSTFDARATSGFGSLAGAAGMKDQFGKVDTKKDTYTGIEKARKEKAEKKAEQYKPGGGEFAAAKEADTKLKDENFKKAEEAKKDTYFDSEEWKSSEEGRKEAAEEAPIHAAIKAEEAANEDEKVARKAQTDAENELKTVENSIKQKQNELDNASYSTTSAQKQAIKEEIKALQAQAAEKTTNVAEKKKQTEEKKARAVDAKATADRGRESLKAIKTRRNESSSRKDWKSEEKQNLEKEAARGDVEYARRVGMAANREEGYKNGVSDDDVKSAKAADAKIRDEASARLKNDPSLSADEKAELTAKVNAKMGENEAKLVDPIRTAWRGVANSAGSVLHVQDYIPGMPKTLSERKRFASAMRGKLKAKSDKEQLAELAKKMIEAEETEKKTATPEAPAAAPAAETTPAAPAADKPAS